MGGLASESWNATGLPEWTVRVEARQAAESDLRAKASWWVLCHSGGKVQRGVSGRSRVWSNVEVGSVGYVCDLDEGDVIAFDQEASCPFIPCHGVDQLLEMGARDSNGMTTLTVKRGYRDTRGRVDHALDCITGESGQIDQGDECITSFGGCIDPLQRDAQ